MRQARSTSVHPPSDTAIVFKLDILSDIFTTLRLNATVYFEADFRAPWGMDMKGGTFANFHLIVTGRCWLSANGSDEQSELNQGDVVVFPHGDRHALLHAPNAQAVPADTIMQHRRKGVNGPEFGGSGATTRMICGHYNYDRTAEHPLITTLPAMIHLRRNNQSDWMLTASRLTVTESENAEQGAGAVVDRLAEILLIQIIRAYADDLDNKNFLTALRDPALTRALTLIHEDISRNWRLEDIAKACGVSRTVLTDRFNHFLGVPPMQYLTDWRMHKARKMLADRRVSVSTVARCVGYATEFSFSKAYKRAFQEGPGATRRQTQMPP